MRYRTFLVPGTRNLRGGTGVLVDFGSCTWYQGYTQFQESLQVNPNQGCDSVKDSQVMVESWSRRLDCERQIYMCYATGVYNIYSVQRKGLFSDAFLLNEYSSLWLLPGTVTKATTSAKNTGAAQ